MYACMLFDMNSPFSDEEKSLRMRAISISAAHPHRNPNPAPILSCRPDGPGGGYPYSPHPETMSNTSALNVRKHGWVGSSGDKHPGLLQLDGMMVLLLALLVKQLGGKPCAHEAKACYDA